MGRGNTVEWGYDKPFSEIYFSALFFPFLLTVHPRGLPAQARNKYYHMQFVSSCSGLAFGECVGASAEKKNAEIRKTT